MYAFEALVLLAYTQENDALREEVACRAGQILASQDAEGWFGPRGRAGATGRAYSPCAPCAAILRRPPTATCCGSWTPFSSTSTAHWPRILWGDAAVARGGRQHTAGAVAVQHHRGRTICSSFAAACASSDAGLGRITSHTFPNPQPLSRTLRWPRLKEALYEEKTEPMEGEHRPYFHHAVLPDQRRETSPLACARTPAPSTFSRAASRSRAASALVGKS